MKDYRYYLRMWAKEKEPKRETIKDLPRMNQVRTQSGSSGQVWNLVITDQQNVSAHNWTEIQPIRAKVQVM